MRIFFIPFILALSLIFSGLAFAERQAFKHFSLEVPDGWEVLENGEMLSVKAKNNSSILVFSPDKLPRGKNLPEFAAFFSKNYQGEAPACDGAGTCQFDYSNNVGAKTHVIIAQADRERDSIFMIVMVGEQHPELPGILNSLQTLEN